MADFLPTLPKAQRAFLVGVQTPEMPVGEGEELLAELTELVENLGLSIVRDVFVKLRAPSPALFVGKGKAEEIIGLAKPKEHALTPFARVNGTQITYPGNQSSLMEPA